MQGQPNLLGKVLRYVTDAADYASGKAAPRANLFAPLLDATADAGKNQLGDTLDTDQAHRLAVTSAWVYSDITLIGRRVSSKAARPQVKKIVGEDLEDMGNHEFEVLLNRPNSLWTGDLLIQYTLWWYLLRGNAYWFLGTPAPGRGPVTELWPLVAPLVLPRPDTLHISRLTGGLCVDYEYRIGGQPYPLPGENVVHFRTPNPFDWWQGLSPLTAAQLAVQMDIAQHKWQRDFFSKDNAVPTNVISLPAEIDEPTFIAAKQAIREEFGQQRKSAIIRAGDMSVQTIQQTLEQMQIIQSRQFNRGEIDRIYGIPEGLISGGLSGDSRLAAEQAFARNTVQPICDAFAEEMTANIAQFYGEDIVIAAPNVIPQERAIDIQEMRVYGEMRTVNENRAELGLDPSPLPEAEIPVIVLRLQARESTSGAATLNEETGSPALADVPSPANEEAALTMRSLALRGELERWRKVALKEAKAGRDPGARTFESAVIPDDLRDFILWAITGANEATVKAAFAAEIEGPTETAPFAAGEMQAMQAVAVEFSKAGHYLALAIGSNGHDADA